MPTAALRRAPLVGSNSIQMPPVRHCELHASTTLSRRLQLKSLISFGRISMASEFMELNGDTDKNGGELPLARYCGRRREPLNMNHYANKKSAAESMLDVALLMANASQLKAVLEQGPEFNLYIPLIILISISLTLQITVGVLLIFIVKWNLNDLNKHFRLNLLENIATGMIFIIVVVNVFITAFGVQQPR